MKQQPAKIKTHYMQLPPVIPPEQSFKYAILKYKFYQEWFRDLGPLERESFIGQWIYQRLLIYADILNSISASMERHSTTVGNYKNPLTNE